MIEPELLEILCCPDSRQELTVLGKPELDGINAGIARGDVQDRGGRTVREPLDGALVRKDGQWVYPVRSGIPVLLVDSAIPFARS